MSGENLPMVALGDSGTSVMVSAASAYPSGFDAVSSEEESSSAQVYRVLQHSLRGRYLLVAVLGVALGSILASAGWLATVPSYRSEALVRLSYDIPRVMQQSDLRPMEVYEASIQSQVALISSARVVGEAMKSPLWVEKGYPAVANSNIDGFATDLKVEHKGGTELVKISYTSNDAVFAALAVRSVVEAYATIYSSMDKQADTEKRAALETRRGELAGQISQLEKRLREESAEFGSSNMERVYDSAVQGLTRVESALLDVRIAMALAQASPRGVAARYTPQQIARMDPTMQRYMAEREDLENALQRLRLRGYGEGHSQVIAAKQQLETIGNRIRDYALDYQATAPSGLGNAGPTQVATPGVMGHSAEELKADEANLTALSNKAKDQMAALGAKKFKIDAITKEINTNQGELTEVVARLTAMRVESGLSGRMSVMSSGEVPLAPSRDRRPQMAAVGALGGLMAPAVILVAVGTLRKRYRYSADAADDLSGKIPLLGILPQLPARLTDPESAADAAQCVHQIRVMLQVQSKETSGPVAYHVTSACPGEGKTSLVAALALSYAAAGLNTLVIDADMIGQRLTRGYGMEDKPGFREAIGDTSKNGVTVYSSGVERLSVLPAGVSDGRDACAISANAVKRIITGMRKRFEVVLIDSGPILGSLEALVVAGVSDGVILTISREQQKPLVDRAVRQLNSVGARIAGMVFNKAERADFRRSVGVTSLRSIPRTPGTAMVRAGVTGTSGFGSLVDSVQTYLPSND